MCSYPVLDSGLQTIRWAPCEEFDAIRGAQSEEFDDSHIIDGRDKS